jgi:hypothetical protein
LILKETLCWVLNKNRFIRWILLRGGVGRIRNTAGQTGTLTWRVYGRGKTVWGRLRIFPAGLCPCGPSMGVTVGWESLLKKLVVKSSRNLQKKKRVTIKFRLKIHWEGPVGLKRLYKASLRSQTGMKSQG